MFKQFTEKLNLLDNPAEKKSAVLALKEGLKKIKDSKPPPESVSPAKYDEQLLTQVDPNSKLNPNDRELTRPRAELKTIMPAVTPATPSTSGVTPYSDVTGLQSVKSGKVLRPMNAFMIWSKSYRKELIKRG